jgi:RNA polymerase sigma-70 factor (ECF subfamily)
MGSTMMGTVDAVVGRVVEDFGSFYDREFPRLVATAYALTGSWATAEDLAQDAMTAAYRRWSQVGLYERPDAWLRRLVSNRAVSVFRRRSSEARLRLRLGRERASAPAPMRVEDTEFWDAVSALPRGQRQVVALHYVDGYGTREISQILDLGESTVKTHLQRGRAVLADVLGLTEGDHDDS